MYLPNILLDSTASISVDTLKTLSLGVLVVLGAIFILKTLFYDIPNKRRNDVPSQSQDEAFSVESAEAVSPAGYEDDTQLIAVLTAAVAAYMEAENEANGIIPDNINTSFRVVSFKRKSGGEWNRSSR